MIQSMAVIPGAFTPATGGYTTSATDYDGTNDYYTRGADLTGNANTGAGTLSFWIRLDGGDGATQRIIGTSTPIRFFCNRQNSDKFRVRGSNTSNTVVLEIISTTSYTVASPGGWIHVIFAWDLSTPETHLWINDSNDEDTGSTTETSSETVDYTQSDYSIGASTTGGQDMNACLSEFWFDNVFIDISTESERRKFIDASGKPVDLGSDGSTPNGASPLIYSPDGDISTNAGTGGNFSATGTPGACSDSPSD
jgi:hypothetical protein